MKRPILFLLTLALLAGPAQADDPGAAGAPKPDARLNVQVTISAQAQPIGEFLKDLSVQAGLPLSAHLNTRDQRVTVLVREQPLWNVMEQLKQLLDALWFTKEVGDTTGYYIKQKHGWQEALARTRQERIARQRQELLDAALRMGAGAGLSFSELRDLVETDPATAIRLASMRESAREYSLGLLAALAGAELDALLAQEPTSGRGRGMTIPYSQLGSAARALLDQIAARARQDGSQPGQSDPRSFGVQAMLFGPSGQGVDGMVLRVTGARRGPMVFVSRRPLLRGGRGRSSPIRATAHALGWTDEELRERLAKTEAGAEILADLDREATARNPLAGIETIEMDLKEGQERSLAHVLAAVREPFEMDFVADAYLAKPGQLGRAARRLRPREERRRSSDVPADIAARVPKEPDKMLDYLAVSFGREWTREGGIVRFRSPEWREDLLADPPQWLVDHLRSRREANGRLDLADLVLLARTLTDDQLSRLPNVDDSPVERWTLFRLQRHLGLLRVYGSLTTQQQRAVFAGGLSGRAMTQDQLSAFAAYLNDAFRRDLAIDEAAGALLMGRYEEVSPERDGGGRRGDRAPESTEAAVFTAWLASGEEREASLYFPPANTADEASRAPQG